MIENLVHDGTAHGAVFAMYADPPWLLHLSGELDLCSVPALTKMLESPTKHGGTVGLELAELTYMDSSGLHVILNAVDLLGERGRVVLFNPSPMVRRLLEICDLDGMIQVSDHPSCGALPDVTEGGHVFDPLDVTASTDHVSADEGREFPAWAAAHSALKQIVPCL
jgi:anti-sigma B factor antagonist